MSDVAPHEPERRELQVRPENAGGLSPLVQAAMNGQLDTQKLNELLQIQKDYEANEARKAFVAAMAEFKAEPLEVRKTKHVKYQNNKGGVTDYHHADLADVVDAVVAKMSKYGLSHRWATQQENARISVTCIITHEMGHSESVTLSAGADDSGGKNSIQAIGSTVTYLQRYTLMAATGLAAKGMDDDGRGAGKPVETITENQAGDLRVMLTDVQGDEAKFCGLFGVEKLEDLPAKEFGKAINKIKQRARKLEQERNQ